MEAVEAAALVTEPRIQLFLKRLDQKFVLVMSCPERCVLGLVIGDSGLQLESYRLICTRLRSSRCRRNFSVGISIAWSVKPEVKFLLI